MGKQGVSLKHLVITDKNGSNLLAIKAFLENPDNDPTAENNAALRLALPACREVTSLLLRDPRILDKLHEMKDTFNLQISLQTALNTGKTDMVSMVVRILWPEVPRTQIPPPFEGSPYAGKILLKYEEKRKKILAENSTKLTHVFLRTTKRLPADVCGLIAEFLPTNRLPTIFMRKPIVG